MINIIAQVVVNNVPAYAHQKNLLYWIVRYVDKELWFYGAWEDENEAKGVLSKIENGLMIKNPAVQ